MSPLKNRSLEKNQQSIGFDIFSYIILLLLSVITMAPLLWGLSTSLKSAAEINLFPPIVLPTVAETTSYYKVLFLSNFRVYFVNSLYVTLISVMVSVMIAAHAGYALSRFRIRFKQQLMFMILLTTMIPIVALLIPLYLMAVKTHLYNTRAVMVLIYAAWRTPILTWILTSFFDKSPLEIEEAARVDGCSRIMIFYRIVLPISQSGIAAVALLSTVYVWNDFLIAFTFTTKEELRMVSIGLYNYITQYGIQWGELMAAVMISVIPILIMFITLQKRFVEGLAAGAVKG